jgi:organic hydroperoxide reductase OsmC/OhrA
MIAEHLDIRLASLDVAVDAECDVRGCLLVDPSVAVGFQGMRCRVRVEPEGIVEPQRLQMLIAAAEKSCVVLQTLRKGVSVQTHVDANDLATITPVR